MADLSAEKSTPILYDAVFSQRSLSLGAEPIEILVSSGLLGNMV